VLEKPELEKEKADLVGFFFSTLTKLLRVQLFYILNQRPVKRAF